MAEHKKVATALKTVLADTYSLYLQTQNFHWNVTGEDFLQYHELFEKQYTDYAEAIDEIAENIRTLGEFSPGTFQAFIEMSSIQQVDEAQSTEAMLKVLVSQTEIVIKSLHKLQKESEHAGNVAIEDLAVGRIRAHNHHLWMLTSSAHR